ncbi:D-amino-acid transaminase [Cytobacillus spongiae]|uniref:D-amino-acid transaminase n=1 Tax=Cytobacillus spongiae TaxID=2901381 RepID=UPI001F3F2B15|nr:D-amino-acid transaminase [Cytobacillus spongiae]UII57750.1 D-amino-acid transaminase [Cytobacillus spongiae]
MSIGYINGKYISLDETVIPIDERGHQFGDGVYEVIRFYAGQPFMLDEHIERLINSSYAIKLPITDDLDSFRKLIMEAVQKAGISDCNVYIQITRGIATRNHLFPNVPVSITMTVRPAKTIDKDERAKGVFAITRDDERWANCYIKSLNLLPNILAKQEAEDQGCFEAILLKEGFVTEGTSSNVYVVKDGKVYTTPLSKQILPGITRMAVKQIAEKLEISFIEQHVSQEELMEADEVFVTSTTAEILPVVKINKCAVGNGIPGEITTTLYEEFCRTIENQK